MAGENENMPCVLQLEERLTEDAMVGLDGTTATKHTHTVTLQRVTYTTG